MLDLPLAFTERTATALEGQFPAFLESLQETPSVSIRRNRRKPSRAFRDAEPIAWCPAGRYLNHRPVFALDPLWHAGAYYVQEPSSMLLDFALRMCLDATRPYRALDLCAAPGGKTTLLADFLSDDSLLVANEVIRSRSGILAENVTRWGWPNVAVANHDPADFGALAGFFDVVLVDAPCSGEGLFRKLPASVKEWSEENTALCAARQRRILSAALPLVRPGGYLFYSTCTFNPDENDGAVRDALATGEVEVVTLSPPNDWGMTATEYGLQCWPHQVRGEGFYLAVLRKTDGDTLDGTATTFRRLKPTGISAADAARALLVEPNPYSLYTRQTGEVVIVSLPLARSLATLEMALSRVSTGLPIGTMKGRDLVPAHELAQSVALRPEVPSYDLALRDALRYLRKEPFDVPEDTPRGWTVMRYNGHVLGWAKVLPGRINNYLPTPLRLRRSGEPLSQPGVDELPGEG